jgi:hypothetical protein
MTDVEALAIKLREAKETIRQLQARLKEVEAERDRYGRIELRKPLTDDEWITVSEWCKEVDQFVQDYTTGPVVPFEDIVREVEEQVQAWELEDQAQAGREAREPAA